MASRIGPTFRHLLCLILPLSLLLGFPLDQVARAKESAGAPSSEAKGTTDTSRSKYNEKSKYNGPGVSPRRVAGEVAAGVGGSFAAGLLGFGVAVALASGCAPGEGLCGYASLIMAVPVFAAAGLALPPLAMYAAGNAGGGSGGFGYTVLGWTLGAAVGVPLMWAAASDAPAVAIPVGAALMLGGGVLGYELSSHDNHPHPRPTALSQLSFAPRLTPTSELAGGVVHFSSTF